jgi:NADPH-dependent 2,4-dienoyl-CoA reductase/sulfur reductase-like enzyme
VNSATKLSGGVAQLDQVTTPRSGDCDIAVIGAGPYGLSAGAHLKAKGLRVRVFGEPMEFWSDKMPAGMLLRSPREASSISGPAGAFTLEAYETASGIQPLAPLPLETFVDYGLWFRRQLDSDLDRRTVAQADLDGAGFRLTLQDGEVVRIGKLVVAAGIGPFQRKPAQFATLTEKQVSHCYEGRKFREFSGKRIAVIGAGQSALESAALLRESGAEVEVIAKIDELRWIGGHRWLHHLGPISAMLYSKHDVGPAGISRLVAAPQLVYRIPLKLRDRIRKRAVRPAGSPWLPPRLTTVKITLGRTVQGASSRGGEVHLKLDDASERRVDHVLLGTGYDVDISRYDFLSPELVKQVRQLDGYPALTGGFCSSVPGLYFIGATAARSFGPLLYFVAGTEFASRELVADVVRNSAIRRCHLAVGGNTRQFTF